MDPSFLVPHRFVKIVWALKLFGNRLAGSEELPDNLIQVMAEIICSYCALRSL